MLWNESQRILDARVSVIDDLLDEIDNFGHVLTDPCENVRRQYLAQEHWPLDKVMYRYLFWKFRPNKWTLNISARVAIRPIYSKLVLPSRKSIEIIINIKIKKLKIKNKIDFLF